MPRREPAAALVIVALLLSAGPAAVAEQRGKAPVQSLENVERALEQDKTRAEDLAKRSAAVAAELEEVRRKMIAAAAATQDEEEQVGEIESTLAALRAAEAEKSLALKGERARLSLTLGTLERLALYPPEALAALPESPVDTLRSALLLRAAVPAIEARAGKLRADLEALHTVRAQIAAERRAAERAKGRLVADRERLAALFERKTELFRGLEKERQGAEDRVAKLGAQAKDLRELMARIEAEQRARIEAEQKARLEAEQKAREALARVKPPSGPPHVAPATPPEQERLATLPPGAPTAIRPMGEAQGRLTLPARGEIAREFGESDSYGASSKGITIRTHPDAQVVAPYDGQVAYAGAFRGYGQILIIEHSEGYHTLLAGLSRVDAVAGQWLLAGEPIGVMGPSESGDPELYVELRRNGRPINPLPWLAFHKGKVSG
ncbi:MAG: murein hydrolase activator EnvC family protein [Alphaproteobacteria bacterium]